MYFLYPILGVHYNSANSEFQTNIRSENPLEQAKARAVNKTESKSPDYVFISYSRRDKDYAHKTAQILKQLARCDVFLDTINMHAGDDWQLEIAEAIDRADVFKLLWSQHSAKSKYCQYEWQYALKHK